MTGPTWYESSFRRCLVDMHIDDWDPAFLSKFDPEVYVERMKTARVRSAMVYANSHVGHCYWPTRCGHMHGGLRGRDIFGEVNALCGKEGIDFIAYYSLIFNNWAYDHDASWRIIDVNGKSSRQKSELTLVSGRYGLCCPNTGYRDFVLAQIEELCAYPFAAIFFDMTFWPAVCYCEGCKRRYNLETGEDIPAVFDWEDASWVRFQHKREAWMAEFARMATDAVKRVKPDAQVLHNGSPPTIFSWQFGAGKGVLDACDYLGADFYGSSLQQSFICKLFANMSGLMPFEYYTSRCEPNLNEDHVATKSLDRLKLHNYITLAHNGAFLFIDAIDPDGSLNPQVYDTMGEVFGESAPYEAELGGAMISNVALYYSFQSKYAPDETGTPDQGSMFMPHMNAILGAAGMMQSNHIPYTVVSESNLHELGKYDVLVLPGLTNVTAEEAAAFERFVREGGGLYASFLKPIPLLADLAGIAFKGKTAAATTFVGPASAGDPLLKGLSARYPLTLPSAQLLAEPLPGREVRARIGLAYTDPQDPSRFASIHSNPPGTTTRHPAIVSGAYGNGKVIWAAAAIEAVDREPHRRLLSEIVKELAPRPFAFETDAPPAVEVMLVHQPERKRHVIHMINAQEKLPPVRAATITVRVGTERPPAAVTILPDGRPLAFKYADNRVEAIVPELSLYQMIAIQYE